MFGWGRPERKTQILDLETLEVPSTHSGSKTNLVEGPSRTGPATSAQIQGDGSENQLNRELRLTGASKKEVDPARQKQILMNLRDGAVREEATVLDAFHKRQMLTCGFNEDEDLTIQYSWESLVAAKAKTSRLNLQRNNVSSQDVTLVAKCVTIEKAADPLADGLLHALNELTESGTADQNLWLSPAVEAVIQHKWEHWARKYLVLEFILYMGWLFCFTGFLLIYIDGNLTEKFSRMNAEEKTLSILAYVADTFAMIFMCPFVLIEFNSICYYKMQWIQMWNLIDVGAYTLQFFITISHYTHKHFTEDAYCTILAVQCALLFIKVQYFSRVMGVGTSYIEILKPLLYHVRYFLLFILLTTISAALSFAVLYKKDVEANKKIQQDGDIDEDDYNDSLDDFSSAIKSLVTTYAVLLGSFEPGYVFETTNSFVKGAFFLIFQFFMSITVLNLLIAVITESYASITANQRILYNKGRAQLINELEIVCPRPFRQNWKPYVHFLVYEKSEPMEPKESAEETPESSLAVFATETKNALDDLKNVIQALREEVAEIREKI